MLRKTAWLTGLLLCAAALLFGCGSNGGGTTPSATIDQNYDFTAAGVQPGVDSRDPGKSRITGTLTDTSTQALPGVTVTLQKLSSSRAAVGSISTTSENDGSYVFGNVVPGQYRVTIGTQTKSVTANADADATADFQDIAPQVDHNYDFTAAGVQPGVEVRDSGKSRIGGALTDSASQAVPGISVTLERLTTSSSRASIGSITTTSASNGSYVFGNVEPGQYRVTVQTQTKDVAAGADQDVLASFSGVLANGSGGNLPDARYKWNLIIVMNADNDLETYGVADVNEMEMLPNSDDVKIVVLMDRARGYDFTNGNWTDTRRFVIQHDTDTSLMTSALSTSEGGQAEVLGELDTGSPTVVRDFIVWAMQNYPAEHYLVDFWNHGAGWRKYDSTAGGRGVLYDDTSRTNLKTTDLDNVLDLPAKVDIAAFDSSLMQMASVGYQIRNYCDYVVGSEESPPGEGYPYQAILKPLFDAPTIAARAFAAAIVNETVDTIGANYSLTQSAFRSDQLASLRVAISNFADVLAAKNATFHAQILAARNAAVRYGSGAPDYEGYRDLVDFIENVIARTADADLTSAGQAVKDAMTAALVAERHTGSSVNGSNGLAIYIPLVDDWVVERLSYKSTMFGQDGRWDEWLDVFLGL